MHYFKQGKTSDQVNERILSFKSSLAAGLVAAAITNPIDVITLNKLTGDKNFSVVQFVKEQGLR
jgi:hypothetical protein